MSKLLPKCGLILDERSYIALLYRVCERDICGEMVNMLIFRIGSLPDIREKGMTVIGYVKLIPE